MKKSIALLILLFIVAVVSLAYKKLVFDYQRDQTYESSVTVLIPKNIPAKTIGLLLEKEGVIPSSDLFYWSIRLRQLGPKLRSGEYEFPKMRSLHSIIQKLIKGDILYHRLTIAEGLTTRDIRAILRAEPKLVGDLPRDILEGSLLPETYTFSRGSSRQDLIKDMQSDLQKALKGLWKKRAENLPLRTKQEALILASIVEKETALEGERTHIAAVFLNRLRKGMLLQTDPTLIYAIEAEIGKDIGRALLKKDLKIESPFNTYLHVGLPPTPICHPGLASIKAVLNPIQSEDLFFVADGTGGHVFSKTYKEHAKNHNKWRKIRRNKLK